MMKYVIVILFIAFLSSGIKASNTWTGSRITARENQNESNTWLNFVKTFDIQDMPQEALAQIACDSKYWMWINGELVIFEGQLKRGPTPNDTYYDEINIVPHLKPGNNKIAILVWFFGKDGFSHKNSGQAGLVFQCNSLGIISDNTWLSRINSAFEHTHPPYPNYRLSESNIRFDARKGDFEWLKLESNLKGFAQAKIIGDAESAPWNNLIKRPIPLWKDFGMKEYDLVPDLPFVSNGDTIICHLPYNAQITPYFIIESEEGNEIGILTDHYFGGGPPNVRAEYITSNGIQEYESLGWMNGHKVKYCFPQGVKVLELKYRETGYDTEFTGNFHCNDPFYNTLWQKAVRTLYVTMRDTYMDCPDRERAQWWGDVVNESGETFYALSPSSAKLTAKGMLELINWQKDNRALFSPVPSGNYDRELPGQMLASIGYYGFWNYYQNTGDKKTIELTYEGVQRYLDIWEIGENGILIPRQGDWYWGDWGTNVDKQGLYNAWYYLALKGFKNMSELLGKKEAVNKIENAMSNFKIAFNNVIWNGREYRYPNYKEDTDDRLQALAVVAGLADKDKFQNIYDLLQTQKHASPYMEKYVLEALFLMGYPEFGLQRMKERFWVMVNDPEITTLYEGWGIGKEGYGGGSVNHAWSGGGLTILSQYLCGLSALSPAWETIQIKPQLGNLEFAKTSNFTIAGEVGVQVRKDKRNFIINAIIPTGSTGIVCVPDSYQIIKLNKKVIWSQQVRNSSQATFLGAKDGYNQFEVKNGKWDFVAE